MAGVLMISFNGSKMELRIQKIKEDTEDGVTE
jgi:hypothetical protein